MITWVFFIYSLMISKNKKKEINISQEWIYNYSLYYLSKYSSSSKNLEKVIKKKLIKLSKNNTLIIDEVDQWINLTIQKLEENKILDDLEFSKSKALSLFRSGKSSKMIYGKLKNFGISDEYIRIAISNISENHIDSNSNEDLDYNAALIFARKKNISLDKLRNEPKDKIQKSLKKFNNAGFSLSTLKKLVDLDLIDFQN